MKKYSTQQESSNPNKSRIAELRELYEDGILTKEELLNSEITPEVYQVFCEERAIPRNMRKTIADNLVGHIALTFELVYPESKKMAIEQGYLQKLLETEFVNSETTELMKKISQRMRRFTEK